jgi:glyoxylase-like metal-dependent hydrolase (beta-lactamase superfamily II)
MGAQQFVVGEITITCIVEGEIPGIPPVFFFPAATNETVQQHEWLVPDYADAAGNITMRVQAFVVRTPTRTIIVDPCVGNGKTRSLPFWNQLATDWLQQLIDAGVQPDAVDLVVHTHLHEDHLGWDTHLVDGEWRPTFPHARHLYTAAELEFVQQRSSDADPIYTDSVAPILTAGLADIVEPDADLGEGLRLAPSPGHTPGHVSLWVETDAGTVLLTGDFMHHPVQFAHPELAETADADIEVARATRLRMITEAIERDALIVGTHFSTRPAGRAVADGDAWRFVPAD